MGLCGSKESSDDLAKKAAEKERSKALEDKMRNAHFQEQQIVKLLLLGAGESGKSTLFKQMITIYGKGYPDHERAGFVSIIHNNIISSMKTLCHQCENFGHVAAALEPSKNYIEDLRGDEIIDANLGAHIKALWYDKGIQQTYDNRSKFQLTDSAQYFFERLDEVMKPDYLPSQQDVLRSRVRTTGIVENSFEIEGNHFKMYDVGGQRNERKKWIHCFQEVTAVIFVAAISEYDQMLYEDSNTNRMVEALNLFEEICNSRWFHDTSVMLFLNKRDLFQEKIKKVSIKVCFPEYDGVQSYEAGCEFIKRQFESRNRNPDKQIYSHVTTATDTENVHVVFNSVKDIIIRNMLREVGVNWDT